MKSKGPPRARKDGTKKIIEQIKQGKQKLKDHNTVEDNTETLDDKREVFPTRQRFISITFAHVKSSCACAY